MQQRSQGIRNYLPEPSAEELDGTPTHTAQMLDISGK